jgi:hypothetical protein
MAQSILQEDRECYLCGKNGASDPLDVHHIFNGAYRKKSEKYGLKVYLCHNSCHIFGKNAVHQSGAVSNALKAEAQQKAMDYYGWTIEEFRELFGKNYL